MLFFNSSCVIAVFLNLPVSLLRAVRYPRTELSGDKAEYLRT